jgi:hypothetical protein
VAGDGWRLRNAGGGGRFHRQSLAFAEAQQGRQLSVVGGRRQPFRRSSEHELSSACGRLRETPTIYCVTGRSTVATLFSSVSVSNKATDFSLTFCCIIDAGEEFLGFSDTFSVVLKNHR